MNPIVHLKQTIPMFLRVSLLMCLFMSWSAQAVSPPPDGGYPNNNTAEGTLALFSLTTGSANTAVGFAALALNLFGTDNTALGTGALLNNTASANTGIGSLALFNNMQGTRNTATGFAALFSNTTAFNNSGSDNTAFGFGGLAINTIGFDNTAVGSQALLNNIEGANNTAVGFKALFNITSIMGNHGDRNTAIGDSALFNNTIGSDNTAIGTGALGNATGSNCIAIGFTAGSNIGSSDNVIAIGSSGDDVDNTCFIGNIRGVTTQNDDAIGVVVDSAGQLGTLSSSRRFKKDIQTMGKASEAVLALKPVTFRYKNGKKGMLQFGLIAEEVANVDPDLVVHDKNGEIYSVRYDQVNAMLLNEFLKEHRHVQEQDTIIAWQQKQIEALAAGLQKVTTQLELNKSEPRTVLNNR